MISPGKGSSPVSRAFRRIKKDRLAVISLAVIIFYAVIALLAASGVIFSDYGLKTGESYQAPSAEHLAGTDFMGRDVLARTVHGSKISMSVGLITTLIAIPIGVFFGALAGYYRGKVDEIIVWFYSTLDSIPYLLLLLALTMVLGRGIGSVYLAIGLTSWVGICRVVRAEFIKQKELDFVQAARAVGTGDFRIIFFHILPNVIHLVLINFSLRFVSAIKSEVILSYLGLGAQQEPSWGIMISDARLELIGRGVYWQLAAATAAMFFIILAFNVFNDSLRDALDPKS